MNTRGEMMVCYCRGCGYDLRQSADRCPECGRSFDRDNPRTFHSTPHSLRLRRGFKRVLLLLLLISVPPFSGFAWMVWGWREEQAQIVALEHEGWTVEATRPLHPWLPKCLPARWAHFADRVDHLELWVHGPPLESLKGVAQLTRLRTLQNQIGRAHV